MKSALGLAPLVINELYALIPDIKRRGIGILIVEQDIERSLAVADRFYCLLEGKVIPCRAVRTKSPAIS